MIMIMRKMRIIMIIGGVQWSDHHNDHNNEEKEDNYDNGGIDDVNGELF